MLTDCSQLGCDYLIVSETGSLYIGFGRSFGGIQISANSWALEEGDHMSE